MTDNPSDCRIPFLPVEEAKRLGKEYGVPSSMAHLNVFRVMLNHPELAAAVSVLHADLLVTSLGYVTSDGDERELLHAPHTHCSQHVRCASGHCAPHRQLAYNVTEL